MAGPKFKMRTAAWDVAVVIGVIVLLVIGFGGVFLLQSGSEPSGTPTFVFVLALGVITFALFAGPGIVYSARKRMAPVKKVLPGGTMAWIRSHLYLPILAIAATYVHATVVPFREALTSGKVLFVIGVLVLISGWARHHMIGVQKEALNVDVAISKMATGQPREFRQLVTDFRENRRPLQEIEADVRALPSDLQERWGRIREMSAAVEKHFPRSGGQSMGVRYYKVWKALHPPLSIALFVVLGYHIWDVLGATDTVIRGDKHDFAASSECADCHQRIFEEWEVSAMAHAQTSTIMVSQLPVTIGKNKELAEDLGEDQEELFFAAAKVCINCHAPVGALFTDEVDALLPFDAENTLGEGEVAIPGGNAAVQSDGIGCITCHTMREPPAERAGFGLLDIDAGGLGAYGTQFGPLFDDPDPLPTRIHGMGTGEDGWWDDPISVSRMCGACHNVKADIDGDGLSPTDEPEVFDDPFAQPDSDGDNILDQNELDNQDGTLDDLILQTTFDEWQDYVVAYDEVLAGDEDTVVDEPLGCIECHMPTEGDAPAVEFAPGVLSTPQRDGRSHSFPGVDYDLDVSHYPSPEALAVALAERKALLGTAVTLEVSNRGEIAPGVFVADVEVSNNLLGHSFPTGFAFARQFWLEVKAETSDGDEVCLLDPAQGIATPCASGVIDDPADDLRQCDISQIAPIIARDFEIPEAQVGNIDVQFAVSFGPNDCDPWLSNFQKILTDGDPEDDGIAEEVPYQSFLADIVKLRTRVATQQVMRPLESVREIEGVEDSRRITLPYAFDSQGIDPDDIVVTATLKFRHLPPYFVRALRAELEELDEEPPEQALLDPDALLENMVVDDVVTAQSGEGEVLACEGPQNDPEASIFECIDDEGAEEVEGAEEDDAEESRGPTARSGDGSVEFDGRAAAHAGLLPDRRFWLPWLAVLASFTAALWLVRFRLLRRAGPST